MSSGGRGSWAGIARKAEYQNSASSDVMSCARSSAPSGVYCAASQLVWSSKGAEPAARISAHWRGVTSLLMAGPYQTQAAASLSWVHPRELPLRGFHLMVSLKGVSGHHPSRRAASSRLAVSERSLAWDVKYWLL